MPITFRPIKVEHKTASEQPAQDINLDEIEVTTNASVEDKALIEAAVKKLGIDKEHDATLNELVTVLRKGKVRIVYINAKGVQAIARKYVKSCKTISYKFDAYHKDRPAIVVVNAEVVTTEDKEFAAVGCVDVGGMPLSVALKKAETNAFMRALRLAVGIPFYDEVDASAAVANAE